MALGEINFSSSFPPVQWSPPQTSTDSPLYPLIFFSPIRTFWKQSTLFQMGLSRLEEDYGVFGITPSYSRMRSVTQGVNRGLC